MFLMECFYFYGVKHHRILFHLILYSVLYYSLYKQVVVCLSYLPSTLNWGGVSRSCAPHPKFNVEITDRQVRTGKKAIKYMMDSWQDTVVIHIIESFARAYNTPGLLLACG